MFLRCSYFLGNSSLNVLINMVLIKKKRVTMVVGGLIVSFFFLAAYLVGAGITIQIVWNSTWVRSLKFY